MSVDSGCALGMGRGGLEIRLSFVEFGGLIMFAAFGLFSPRSLALRALKTLPSFFPDFIYFLRDNLELLLSYRNLFSLLCLITSVKLIDFYLDIPPLSKRRLLILLIDESLPRISPKESSFLFGNCV